MSTCHCLHDVTAEMSSDFLSFNILCHEFVLTVCLGACHLGPVTCKPFVSEAVTKTCGSRAG